jgi:ribonuclease HI
MHYILYADGGARGNPGPAGAGAVAFDALGKRVVEVSDYLGETTNNVAEYEAVLRGLSALLKEFGEDHLKTIGVLVKMDSELVIKQMKGEYKVKHPNLIGRHFEIKNLLARHFGKVEFVHVPREQNADADELANRAMDQKLTKG